LSALPKPVGQRRRSRPFDAIIFAFALEKTGDEVTLVTNWASGNDVWYDGNDLAEFTPGQIADAQRYGCAIDDWLTQQGYRCVFVPADAISITVEVASGRTHG
jgi:hypothetical protein